jgi:hypothetical protein
MHPDRTPNIGHASHITVPLATVDARLFAVILLFSGRRSLLAIVGMSPLLSKRTPIFRTIPRRSCRAVAPARILRDRVLR